MIGIGVLMLDWPVVLDLIIVDKLIGYW
jgi:hypothetical protein